MDNGYALMDLTVYGSQEQWENSPAGWPQHRSNLRSAGGGPDWPPVTEWPSGRPVAQWPRIDAGHPDDLSAGVDDSGPSGTTAEDSVTVTYFDR